MYFCFNMGLLIAFSTTMCHLMTYVFSGVLLDDTLNLVKTFAEGSRSVVIVGFHVISVGFLVS